MASEKCTCGCCDTTDVEQPREKESEFSRPSRLRLVQVADRLAEIDERLAKLDGRVA
jgi:hypothetical protein